MKITNTMDTPLPLAVWAVDDVYDYSDMPKTISATQLLKPLKQILLASRVPEYLQVKDVQDFIAPSYGTALHAAIEAAWINRYKENMSRLGQPESVIKRIKINPNPNELTENDLPVYIEQRFEKEINGWTVTGRADFIIEGTVNDNKSTSVYSYIYGSHDTDYQLQGSIYRWLAPQKITEEFMQINFIFTDWQKSKTREKDYPQSRVISKRIPLLTLSQTEEFIVKKLQQIDEYSNKMQEEMPSCSDEELWRAAPVWKVYKDESSVRSMKNFDNPDAAYKFLYEIKGGKGIIKEVLGEPKRCMYCDAFPICSQRKAMIND